MARTRSGGAWIVTPVAAFLIYVGTAVAGFSLEADRASSIPVYLAPGAALAVMLRFGTGLWPAVLAAAFAVGLIRGVGPEFAILSGGTVTLFAILACHSLQWSGFRSDLSRLRDAVLLIVYAAIGSTAVANLFLYVGLAFLRPTDSVAIAGASWVGNAIGVLVAAPPLLLWTAPSRPHRERVRAHAAEAIFLFALLLVACDAAFGGWLGTGSANYPLAFLPFPVLLWIGFRLGPLALVTATSMASGAALYGTARGLGPFAVQAGAASIALDWIFLAVMQITFLLLTAVLAEHGVAEAALRTEKERAESATRAKSEFLSVMNHELRTPLNSILLAIDLLLESRLSGEQRDLGKTVLRAGEALRTLVGDTLDMARIEEGRMELQSADFSPRDLSSGVIDVFADAAHRKKIQLIEAVDTKLPETLRGDAARLRQILINLVGNALKFTDEGQIELRTERRESEAGMARILWEIRDTGAGISELDQESIFEPFTQADGGSARQYGGTGLGLAISRRLADLMGGEIDVESELGLGSTFWLSVPLDTVPAPEELAPPLVREKVA